MSTTRMPALARRGKRKGTSSGGGSKLDLKRRSAPIGNQIRSVERLLNRDNLPSPLREAQEARLKQLRETYAKEKRLAEQKTEKKRELRYKQVRFVERRKVERAIRRAEKELRNAFDAEHREQVAKKLVQLREDLDYVRFFPPTEKYISLFKTNNDEAANLQKQKIWDLIKSHREEAAAVGFELEETTTSPEEDFATATEEEDTRDQKVTTARDVILKLKREGKGKGPASAHKQSKTDNQKGKTVNGCIKNTDPDPDSEPEPVSISDDDFFIKDPGPAGLKPGVVAVKPASATFNDKRQINGKRKGAMSNMKESVSQPDDPSHNEKRKRKRKRPNKHK